jgi:hypothetical protein
MKETVLCLALFASLGPFAADGERQMFVKSWEGRTVVVRKTLYSLVYNERGKIGSTRSGKSDGLVVVTPSLGVYYQFDGRQGRDDVVERDVQRIPSAVSAEYEAESLDMRSYRKVEPLALNRFEPGVQFLVRRARIDRDLVVLTFSQADRIINADPVTSVRIKWPLVLSESFAEREVVEALIRQFVTLPQADGFQ